jgi:hypothetical protein
MVMDQITRAKFLLYRENVRKLSEKNFKNNFIDNKEYRGQNYHLDHKLSILEGFQRGLPEEIVADVANLEILDKSSNLKKGTDSSITFEELIDIISEREEFF